MLYVYFAKWALLGDSLYSLVKKRETGMGELVYIYTNGHHAHAHVSCWNEVPLKFKQNGYSSTSGCEHSYSRIKMLFSG